MQYIGKALSPFVLLNFWSMFILHRTQNKSIFDPSVVSGDLSYNRKVDTKSWSSLEGYSVNAKLSNAALPMNHKDLGTVKKIKNGA